MKNPGEFRDSQNWIGAGMATLDQAVFVPPPPAEMHRAMGDLELFLHDMHPMPVLVKAGLIHAQFETIHPFLDGNGRVGRLLITFFLVQQGILRRPLLYLSYHLKQHRDEYYDLLQRVRTRGDWESWLKFFLGAVAEVANSATETARRILRLREEHRELIRNRAAGKTNAEHLLDHLFERPILNVRQAADLVGVSFPTADSLIGQFVDLGLLNELTGSPRKRLFAYQRYLDLFEQQSGPDAARPNLQQVAWTESDEGTADG